MKQKKNLIAIAVVMAVVATVLFFVIGINSVSVTAYIFALVGIAGLLYCAFTMLDKEGSYPWIAAIPIQALNYLILEIIFSSIILALKELQVFDLETKWFVAIHVVIFALFAIRIIMMRGGSEHIDGAEERQNAKLVQMKMLHSELEALLAEVTDDALKRKLKETIGAVRYSDPVTSESTLDIELELWDEVAALGVMINDEAHSIEKLDKIQTLLKKRNIKAKISK